MAVTLQNRRRQMQVFNLDHAVCCGPDGCGCSDLVATVIEEHPRTGELLPRHIRKKAPGSLTLLALETRRGLPDAILKVPAVIAALDAGAVRVVEQTPVAAAGLRSEVASSTTATPPPVAPPVPVTPPPSRTPPAAESAPTLPAAPAPPPPGGAK